MASATCHGSLLVRISQDVIDRPADCGESLLYPLGVFWRWHLIGDLGDCDPHIGGVNRNVSASERLSGNGDDLIVGKASAKQRQQWNVIMRRNAFGVARPQEAHHPRQHLG